MGLDGYNPKFGKGLQPYDKCGDNKGSDNKTHEFIDDILPKILDFCEFNDTALDVGCGNGRFSHALGRYFNHVLAIDRYTDYDSRFDANNIKFMKIDFDNLIINHKFDLILFWGSFYQTSNYLNTLIKCSNMLLKSGIVVIGDDATRREDRAKNPNEKICYHLGNLLKDAKMKEVNEFIDRNHRITICQTQ